MGRYLANRTIQALITVFIVTSIIFLLFEAMPGDPISRFRADPTITQEKIDRLEREFGLNQPAHERYLLFMKNMFSFQFGESYQYKRPVVDILADRMPRTLALFGAEVIITYALGVMIGSYIGWKRGGATEGGVIVFSLVFYNMPSFWIGLICIWLFAFKLDWFPLNGFSDPGATAAKFQIPADAWYFGAVDFGWHMVLPMLVLILIGIAGIILLMRTSLLEVMGEDYIITAKAKGLPEHLVRKRHANRNAYLPIVTSFTISLALAVSGAVILEQIFAFKGIGYTYLEALLTQDQFLAGATLFILSLLVIFSNILADVLYGWLDPRVRI